MCGNFDGIKNHDLSLGNNPPESAWMEATYYANCPGLESTAISGEEYTASQCSVVSTWRNPRTISEKVS